MDEIEDIRKRKLQKLMRTIKGGDSTMKICVPTLGQEGLNDAVCEHFGRAPTFTAVDMETNEVTVMPNISEHMGGVGVPPEHLADKGIHVMLCSGLGPRAVQMFEQFGIEVYVGASGTVDDAIKAWQAGSLSMATDENACMEHRH